MKLRAYVIKAVFKRNFLSYFSGVIGYLFIVAFVGLGSFLAFNPQFFSNNLANLDQLNALFPVLLLFIVPAITMGAWADERKLGTDELLFTLPASDVEVLLGKYVAVVGVYTVALLFSLSHVIVLMTLGVPDFGLLFTTYFGYWVAGSALLSAGMVASILTNSATVAYVLGALICAIPVFIDRVSPGNRLLQGLSVGEQFRDFGLGMIPVGSLLYFLSLTALMLYLNLVFISRRHWSGGPHGTPMGLHFVARAVSLGLILIALNVVAANANTRIDFTSERVYSLSPTTRILLKEVKPERPVLLQAFISPEVPREHVATRSTLIGLLRQFDQVGGDAVRVRIIDTEKYSEAAQEAKRYGIEPQEIQSERGGRVVVEDVFLGVVATSGANEEVIIPFFDVGTPIEYELTRSVRTVSTAKRKKLGILRTDAKLNGGFDMSSMRSNAEWRIVAELKKQYDVAEVGAEQLASSNYDVLLAAMPSALSDPEVMALVEYIQQGGPTLIIDDPFPYFHGNIAPKMPKPRPGGMFGGGPPPQQKADNGEARKLTSALGIAWNAGESVWDTYDPHPEMTEAFSRLDVVYIGENRFSTMPFNDRSPITDGLQELMLIYPGTIRPREGANTDFIPLIRTSSNSATYDWEEYVSSSPFGGLSLVPIEELRAQQSSTVEHVVAARITGKPKPTEGGKSAAGGKPGVINVVFIADLDMISDPLFMVRDKNWQDIHLDNIPFILNAVDDLAGDTTFLNLRKRRAHHRTLALVEERTQKSKRDQAKDVQDADKSAKQALEDARKSFEEQIKKIDADKSLDERTRQIQKTAVLENQRRQLEVREVEIKNDKNKKVRLSKDKTEREIRTIENSIRLLAIVWPPVPALLLGIFVFAARVREERQGVLPDRLVKKKQS